MPQRQLTKSLCQLKFYSKTGPAGVQPNRCRLSTDALGTAEIRVFTGKHDALFSYMLCTIWRRCEEYLARFPCRRECQFDLDSTVRWWMVRWCWELHVSQTQHGCFSDALYALFVMMHCMNIMMHCVNIMMHGQVTRLQLGNFWQKNHPLFSVSWQCLPPAWYEIGFFLLYFVCSKETKIFFCQIQTHRLRKYTLYFSECLPT